VQALPKTPTTYKGINLRMQKEVLFIKRKHFLSNKKIVLTTLTFTQEKQHPIINGDC